MRAPLRRAAVREMESSSRLAPANSQLLSSNISTTAILPTHHLCGPDLKTHITPYVAKILSQRRICKPTLVVYPSSDNEGRSYNDQIGSIEPGAQQTDYHRSRSKFADLRSCNPPRWKRPPGPIDLVLFLAPGLIGYIAKQQMNPDPRNTPQKMSN
jgi:hypothetical protein